MNQTRTIWKLAKNEGQRFLRGHPWVFSNEIGHGSKGTPPGSLVELHDPRDQPLALGYANPNSLISFRCLERDVSRFETWRENPETPLEENISLALRYRGLIGYSLGESHRIVFGEADGLPGLVIDYYTSREKNAFVIQLHTAGMDRLRDAVRASIKSLAKANSLGEPAIIFRDDASGRTLEGLRTERHSGPFPLKAIVSQEFGIELSTDLHLGQKTGLFLDQRRNIQSIAFQLARMGRKNVRILDLFSYVGAWGVSLSRILKKNSIDSEITFVDASAWALELAKDNLCRSGGNLSQAIVADIVETFPKLPDRSFDVVIVDPPAFQKRKKDIPAGMRAYLKTFSKAMGLCAPQGLLVACSCSQHLSSEGFFEILSRAEVQSRRSFHWLSEGGHSYDHPLSSSFPEGRYLKCLAGSCKN